MQEPNAQKHHRFQKIKNWIKAHRKASIALLGVCIIVLAVGIAFLVYAWNKPSDIAIPPKPKSKVAQKFYSPLTGQEVASEQDTKAPVTAIMIENSPDARPQSGIKDAGQVYEAIAEGGITRFLTLHQQDKPGLIGPVRSLREYYLDWLTPYDASVAHVGGSAEALQNVRNGSYADLDQFFNAGTYWRASDRYAPHNVYTNSERLDALNASKGHTKSDFTSFERTDGKASDAPTAQHIAVNFSSAAFNTTYDWNKDTNTYTRNLGGAPHVDREAGQITPTVVIALHVDENTVMQDGYREQITTTGSGKADVFQNGTVQQVTWRKTSQKAPLELLDDKGAALKLNRGQAWIAAVPNGKGSATWN